MSLPFANSTKTPARAPVGGAPLMAWVNGNSSARDPFSQLIALLTGKSSATPAQFEPDPKIARLLSMYAPKSTEKPAPQPAPAQPKNPIEQLFGSLFVRR